jgi:hypothetical protein
MTSSPQGLSGTKFYYRIWDQFGTKWFSFPNDFMDKLIQLGQVFGGMLPADSRPQVVHSSWRMFIAFKP